MSHAFSSRVGSATHASSRLTASRSKFRPARFTDCSARTAPARRHSSRSLRPCSSLRPDGRVETYSRGMKQRLHLARGLVGEAKGLFLDEPTMGMDPIAARDFRALIGELKGEGRTILLATHDMVEAETVCDRVTLIDRGTILATESPRTLGRMISRFQRIDVEGASPDLLARVGGLAGVHSINEASGSARIEIAEEGATGAVLKLLVDAGVTSVKTSLPSLEEVYVHLIGDRGLEI